MSTSWLERLFAHERLFPYRGSWFLSWVIERYFRSAIGSLSLRKMGNAARAILEMKLGVSRVGSSPCVLRVEPCNVCNLRCPGCACGTGRDPRPKGFMVLEDYQRVLEENKATALIVRLDGMGEPTLHPRFFEMVRIAKSYGMSVTVHTNMATDTCDQAAAFVDSGLDRLVIAIDGVSDETYRRYRVGADFGRVVGRTKRLIEVRNRRGRSRPIIEVQMIELPYNRQDIPVMRQLVRQWGADRFQVTSADRTTKEACLDPRRPRRCFWLWTVGWNLDYHSCGNAFSVPWPALNLRDTPSCQYWNHELIREARRFNVDKSSGVIAADADCKCRRCYEMVVVPLVDDYFCE